VSNQSPALVPDRMKQITGTPFDRGSVVWDHSAALQYGHPPRGTRQAMRLSSSALRAGTPDGCATVWLSLTSRRALLGQDTVETGPLAGRRARSCGSPDRYDALDWLQLLAELPTLV